MYSLEINAGRLVELRFSGEISELEMKAFRSKITEIMVRSGRPVVFCVDSRACAPLVGETELMILGLMRSDHRSVERSAVVLQAGTEVAGQLERAITAAKNPNRRTFVEAREARSFLEPVLERAESERLQMFLSMAAKLS